ncbi:MAG: hypothetical protein AAFV38_11320 [Pseudomonadota bacterium]
MFGFQFLELSIDDRSGAWTRLLGLGGVVGRKTRHIGSIKALAAAIMVLGSAVGPGLSGVLIDFGVGFERQLWWFGVYFLAASAILALGVRRAGQVRFANHSSFDA